MSETMLKLKVVGMYSVNSVSPDIENCESCGDADWGDVLVDGICGRCLVTAWKAAQPPERQHSDPEEADGVGACPNCGDKLFCAMCGEQAMV